MIFLKKCHSRTILTKIPYGNRTYDVWFLVIFAYASGRTRTGHTRTLNSNKYLCFVHYIRFLSQFGRWKSCKGCNLRLGRRNQNHRLLPRPFQCICNSLLNLGKMRRFRQRHKKQFEKKIKKEFWAKYDFWNFFNLFLTMSQNRRSVYYLIIRISPRIIQITPTTITINLGKRISHKSLKSPCWRRSAGFILRSTGCDFVCWEPHDANFNTFVLS